MASLRSSHLSPTFPDSNSPGVAPARVAKARNSFVSHDTHRHRHHHHHHNSINDSTKSVSSAILPSTAFGELLSPVRSVAGGFGALSHHSSSKRDGVEKIGHREKRKGKARDKEREGEGDDDLSRNETLENISIKRKEPRKTWADVQHEQKRRKQGEE